jgi:hypothetical protein
VQTPVVTVGRLTIDRIDPHGSLGSLGAGEGETAGKGELEGAGAGCPQAPLLVPARVQAKKARATSPVRVIAQQYRKAVADATVVVVFGRLATS